MSILTLALGFTWALSPVNGDWNNASNWSPVGPPGTYDNASLGPSTVKSLFVDRVASVGSIEFGRTTYTVTALGGSTFTLDGGGLEMHANAVQYLIIDGAFNGSGGLLRSSDFGTLGRAQVIIKGFVDGNGGEAIIRGRAGSPRIFVNPGAYLIFEDFGSADESIILSKPSYHGAFGGQIYFFGSSDGGRAHVNLVGEFSAIQMQDRVNPVVNLGSLAGAGTVFLGPNTLRLGTNGKDTTFLGRFDANGLAGRVEFLSSSNLAVIAGHGMDIQASVVLGGTLKVRFQGDPVQGQTYSLFHCVGSKSGDFADVQFPDLRNRPNFETGFEGDQYVIRILPQNETPKQKEQ